VVPPSRREGRCFFPPLPSPVAGAALRENPAFLGGAQPKNSKASPPPLSLFLSRSFLLSTRPNFITFVSRLSAFLLTSKVTRHFPPPIFSSKLMLHKISAKNYYREQKDQVP